MGPGLFAGVCVNKAAMRGPFVEGLVLDGQGRDRYAEMWRVNS